jgi:hypothetical protein
MLDKNTFRNTVILFGVVAIASYFGNQIRTTFDTQEKNEEYDLIRKYLLNDIVDSPIQNYHRPKLWIHSKYEINARNWKSFYSRNSTELNQPYIHLTIQSIIKHCGDRFDIMLIDDDSFSQLIPQWSVQVSRLPEPFKTRSRELAMATLLFMYGGIRIPNSFLCFESLYKMFDEGFLGNRPFVTERLNNYTCGIEKHHKALRFVPDSYIMGCRKADPIIGEYVEFCKRNAEDGHFQDQSSFMGEYAKWFISVIDAGNMNLIPGERVGVKSKTKKSITLDDLMEEAPLDLDPYAYGLYIPGDEILSRSKYLWFASMSSDYIIETNLVVAKYLRQAKMKL